MTEEEQKKHARCYELQDLLEPLYVFSSKLKHLQLSYNSLQKVISEIDLIMKKDNLKIFGDEYYVMQVERLFLEILSGIFSIRDCLEKAKIIKLNQDKTIRGLHSSKVGLEDKHTQILNGTLKLNNHHIIAKFTYKCRNKLIHENLQDTKFVTYLFSPRYDDPVHQFIIGCDFFHLMNLTNFNNIEDELNYTVLKEYFLDNHITLLSQKSMINVEGEHFGHIQYVLNQINKNYYLENYHKCLQTYKPSTIWLPDLTKFENQIIHSNRCLEKLQDELLSDTEYVFYLYQDYILNRQKNKDLRNHDFRFNMQKFIEDTYEINLEYYLELHSLLKSDYFASMIIEHEKLQIEIGINEASINECRKRYTAELPKNLNN